MSDFIVAIDLGRYQNEACVYDRLHRLPRHPNASAILRSVRFGPPASAFNKIWARRTFKDDPFCLLITASNVCRSAADSRTIYFFRMATPP
jgi:hypothetical protein